MFALNVAAYRRLEAAINSEAVEIERSVTLRKVFNDTAEAAIGKAQSIIIMTPGPVPVINQATPAPPINRFRDAKRPSEENGESCTSCGNGRSKVTK